MSKVCRTKQHSFTIYLSTVCILAFGGIARAGDVVVLNDGKTIEGKLISEEEDTVVIQTAAGREVLSMKSVRQIRKEKRQDEVAQIDERTTLTPEVSRFVEQAEKYAQAEDIETSYKYYQKAVGIDDSIAIHRRMAQLYFTTAEQIKKRNMAEFEATLAAWEKARDGAMEERRSLHEGVKRYKKLNPENPAYKAATKRHQDSLERIKKCFPFYEKAQTAYNGVLRLSKFNKDFEAAGHIPLCLTINSEMNTRTRGRQLLLTFLDSYKPASAAEHALYKRCQDELARVSDK